MLKRFVSIFIGIIFALTLTLGCGGSPCDCATEQTVIALTARHMPNAVKIAARQGNTFVLRGTGTIVDMRAEEAGQYRYIIVANYHVVGPIAAGFVYISIGSSNTFVPAARVHGRQSARYDLALIETMQLHQRGNAPILSGSGDMRLECLNEDYLTAGQRVITFGNAHLRGIAVSCGIVSQTNVTAAIGNISQPMSLIQTTSGIVAGSSGGPTFDMSGRLIGINAGNDSPAFGYLIPASTVRRVLEL